MKVSVRFLLLLAIVGGAAYVLRTPLQTVGVRIAAEIERRVAPCTSPIRYSIGSFDTRFGISKSDFLAAAKAAETIWEKPSGRDLFEYDLASALEINLVYDYRQETTKKLKTLGLAVDDTQSSYNAIKVKYDGLKADFERKKTRLDAAVAAFNVRQDAHNRQVAYWNAQGGAPADEYARLQAEAETLRAELARLDGEHTALNAEIDTINALADALNRLAGVLNLNVAKYNTVGAATGSEFEEGLYESTPAGQKIDVYEFSSRDKLVRVLAHEMGHALGLDHVDDSDAVMYRLNQSTNAEATATDFAELKRVCGAK